MRVSDGNSGWRHGQWRGAANDRCESLELLAAFDPDVKAASTAAGAMRRAIAQDAHSVLQAAADGIGSPPAPTWPVLPGLPDDEPDLLLKIFGIPAEKLTDDTGSSCDFRVLAFYRFRLPELQRACEPILSLVGDHPPSVFTAVSAVRDLATSPLGSRFGALATSERGFSIHLLRTRSGPVPSCRRRGKRRQGVGGV